LHDRQREIGEFERRFRHFKDEYESLVHEVGADAPDYHLGILWDYIDDNLPDSELLVDEIEDEANALWDMYHDLVRKYPTHDMTHGQTRIRPDFALRNFTAAWNPVRHYFVEATTEQAINYRQWLREHEMAAAQHAAQLAAHQAALEEQGPNPIGYVSDSVVSDAEQQAAQDPSARRVRRRLNNSEDPESPNLSGNGKLINRNRAFDIHTPDFHEMVYNIKRNNERLRVMMEHEANTSYSHEIDADIQDILNELVPEVRLALSDLGRYRSFLNKAGTMSAADRKLAKIVLSAHDYLADNGMLNHFAADEYASTSHASNTSTVPIGGETSDSTIPNGGTLGSGGHLMLAQAMKGGARDPNAPGAPARPPRLPQPEWRQMAAEAIARGNARRQQRPPHLPPQPEWRQMAAEAIARWNAREQQPKPPYIPKYKEHHYLGGSFQFQLVKDSATSLYNKIRREVTDPNSFTRKNAAPIALTAALILSAAVASEMPANTKQEQLYRHDFYEKLQQQQQQKAYVNYFDQPYFDQRPDVIEI
jgi:hypothetical protein